ncbi:ribbon-helix-helix protein, CopG family [Erysipelotrichaceae bacterium 66-17]|uniref:ribbon-helix-helix protein, CopG family n=1 Tax=uncultured Dubosiella sp. TaxID=1937011 RepID=UPI0026234FE9|nr:ribbon-helix-helix protein, CopG family [uncultured Dubosiella sp.]
MKDVAKKKMGRPFVDGEKKDIMLRIRVSEQDLINLDKKCEKEKKTRSELLREFMNK